MISRTIVLAGTKFEVPLLPIRINRIAYPLCRKLHNAGLIDRIIAGKGQVECSPEEMDDLVEIAFIGVQAANSRITREEFDNWPISPPELADAFFIIRYQTGAWIALDSSEPRNDEDLEPGEAEGAETLPT